MDGLTRVDYPDGNYVSYAYDSACRLTKVTTPFGSTSYEYDLLDRLTRVFDRNGYATVYEYDANGNRTAVHYANGFTTTYDYDLLNRLVCEKTVDSNDNVVVQYVYTLGAAGERKSVTELDRTVEYSYDSLYRLTSETITEGEKTTVYTYAYDNVSNRILKTVNGEETVYTYNALNQLVSDSETSYEYDLNGNLVRVIGSAQSALYEYNSENKLIKATVQNDSLVIEESYTYDYQGNRTSKTTHRSDGVTEYVKYLNDNSRLTNVLAEIDSDGNALALYTVGADLVSQERSGRTSIYLYDGHGSVVGLSNESGVVTDTYCYDAFGNLLKSKGSTKNCYRYCGEQFDETTGLYYLRARYMDTTTGRFISQDSYAGSISDPISLHKYLYANANPVMNSDPSGYSVEGVVKPMPMPSGSPLMDMMIAVTIFAVITVITVCNYSAIITSVRSLLEEFEVAESNKYINYSLQLFELHLGGQLSKAYANSEISKKIGEIFDDPYQKGIMLAMLLMASLLSQSVLKVANEMTKQNSDYKYSYAIHHIVPKKLAQATPSVMVLKAVGISVHEEDYRTAYYKPGAEIANLVKIKTKTHIAIHKIDDIYCGWVNGIIVPTYLATYRLGTDVCRITIIGVLQAMKAEISAIDLMII